eukprot:Rhum_TRINITY_DN245_c0_g1::Rhum_TRINITY_DN245_c0_g1_i1::g.889::m.889
MAGKVKLEEVRDYTSEGDESSDLIVMASGTKGALPCRSKTRSALVPPTATVASALAGNSSAASVSHILNPHKAMQGASAAPPTALLSTDEVRAIRGVVAARGGDGLWETPSSSGPPSAAAAAAAPASSTRQRSLSRPEQLSRKTRIACNFMELERLLQSNLPLEGDAGASQAAARRRGGYTRADVIDWAISQIQALQMRVNEAGEQNGELHDYVDGLTESAQYRMKVQSESPPAAEEEVEEEEGSSAGGSNGGDGASPSDGSEPDSEHELFSRLKAVSAVDAMWLLCGGVLAHLAPAEWQDGVAVVAPVQATVPPTHVVVTTRGFLRFVLKATCVVLTALAFKRLVLKSRAVVDILRYGLTHLLEWRQDRLDVPDAAPDSVSEESSEEHEDTATTSPATARGAAGRSLASSSNASSITPHPRTSAAAFVSPRAAKGMASVNHHGHMLHAHPVSAMRKTASADDFETFEVRHTQTQRTSSYRSRAISNPVPYHTRSGQYKAERGQVGDMPSGALNPHHFHLRKYS